MGSDTTGSSRLEKPPSLLGRKAVNMRRATLRSISFACRDAALLITLRWWASMSGWMRTPPL
ncbi:hypothetical protein EYF80_051187 [Liparis tanakae]|uniref:Uncharacterized protein n=1 Tax=Liparis tanakae TaxID=230148 RepID=A0A4Z2FD00_9TELE|nr:hypothetical protein EYF80_051187 [Liparis tanakae]